MTASGNIVVLFADQSANLARITPYEVEFRLMTAGPAAAAFFNHATQVLDFTAGEVKVLSSSSGAGLPTSLRPSSNWTRANFNH